MKHLQYFLDAANSGSLNSKYTGQINSQGSAVVHYGTGPGYTVGSVWYAPNSGGSILSPKTQTSGLAALNSAAKVRFCVRAINFGWIVADEWFDPGALVR